ncbi:MAG: SPOR domain-containing protein [Cycloclasticus sp.]|nr:SPOR domain-containing protein [Cycloclasticus sp.]
MSKEDSLEDGAFISVQRQQRLDLIHHLIPNTRQVILVRGPEKSGKSFFIRQFKAQANSDWNVCSVDAKQMMGSDEPLAVIAKAFDELVESEKPLMVRFTSWSKAAKTVIICVEDVHQLDSNRLEFLFQLAQSHDCLHLLLTSSDNLAEDVDARCQLIDIEPLSQKETFDYAKSRVHTKGLDFVNIAGIDSVVLFIETGGLPGRINDALDQLAQVTVGDVEKKSPVKGLSAKWTVVALLIIATLIIFSLFPRGDEELVNKNQAAEMNKQATIITSENDPVSVTTLDAPGVNKDQPLLDKVKNKQEEVITLAAPPLSDSDLAPNVDTIEVDPKTVSNKKQLEGKATAKVVAKKPELTLKTQVLAIEEKKEALIADPEKTPAALEINHKWIKEREAGHYTLQLLGVSTEQAAKEFVTRHKDLNNLIYFKNKRNKGQWFSVLYGDFVNKTEASKASKSVPASLGKLKPWLRNFKDIRLELFTEN